MSRNENYLLNKMVLLKKTNVTELLGSELKKYRLKKEVLKMLYASDIMSAADLSFSVGVSNPTMRNLIEELIKEGYVKSYGLGESNGGRKPALFGLIENTLFVIACEMGRFHSKVTIFNPRHDQVARTLLVETEIDDPDLEDKLFDAATVLLNESQIQYEHIIGVAVGMPGLVDAEKGINYTIKNPENNHIKERLENRFEKEVLIENDARSQAYGEYMFGDAKEVENALVVNWSWGLGLGMILNGKCFSGATGFAGEFSHIKLEEGGDLCICGKRGCLETIASATALVRMAKEGIQQDKVSQLTRKFGENIQEITPEDIIKAAKRGDEFAISLLSKIGLGMGKGLAILIQLLNPEVIVLSGDLAKAKQYVLIPIQQTLNRYCLENISQQAEIKISTHNQGAGLLGVTAMFYNYLFNQTSIRSNYKSVQIKT